MRNNKNNIIVGAIIAAVAVAGIAAFSINKEGAKMDNSLMSQSAAGQADKNSSEYSRFAALKGEDYDRTFVTDMTAHHQGAIEMANLALANASHQEIKTLATAIVSTQSSEASSMTEWQKKWGYPASNSSKMMDHTSMNTENAHVGAATELGGKTGEAFDKAFLEQMTMHHQSAINMAAPGKTNAQHQELKDLTEAIVTAQTKELKQMKQWQSDWGYKN